MGRKDFQIKIRGHRIEVNEIETALLNLDVVKEAAVIARQDQSDHQALVAYIVPKGPSTPTLSTLRAALSEKLPDYMIPSTFITLEVLPLTPSGKVDRQNLPHPDNSRPILASRFCRAPHSHRSSTRSYLGECS